MTIHENLKAQVKEAMKEKNPGKLTTIRGLLSAMTNEAVSRGHKPDQLLTDEEALAVIKRAAKQRKDAIDQFEAGGRSDLAESEKLELAYIETLLPQTMSREEIKKVAEARRAELGLTDKSQAGKFTGVLMKELQGRADGALVKAVVDELLN
jgi:uncharacterized protein YqeY